MDLIGGRFLTLNTVVRVNQIEASRKLSVGEDESSIHTQEAIRTFREAIYRGWPEGKITWSMSWGALTDTRENYKQIREIVKEYHFLYGDDVTYIPGAYFSNAYSTKEEVNVEIHEGLQKVKELIGDGFKPLSIVAGFLSAENQQYLSQVEDMHVCQGNIWSQYAIDNQDGEGSISYPYYPSKEHFCKPAQGKADFIDCVNLDGWTMDFVSARYEGATSVSDKNEYNSRMGVGPIETLGRYGAEKGLSEIIEVTKNHFNEGLKHNDFGWVTNNWEICLVKQIGLLEQLTQWLKYIHKTWPDAHMITQGEFGLLWRENYKDNSNINYYFSQSGTGIGGSNSYEKVTWYMNKHFRLAFLENLNTKEEKVIDFTRYDINAEEPTTTTRNWSLMGKINQKQTREQDKPISFQALDKEDKEYILSVIKGK